MLWTLTLPEGADKHISAINVSSTGSVHVVWKHPMRIDLAADGRDMMMVSIAANRMDIRASQPARICRRCNDDQTLPGVEICSICGTRFEEKVKEIEPLRCGKCAACRRGDPCLDPPTNL
jgi:hypothetical protein